MRSKICHFTYISIYFDYEAAKRGNSGIRRRNIARDVFKAYAVLFSITLVLCLHGEF